MPAEIDATYRAGLGHRHEQAELARLQPERPQFLVALAASGISVENDPKPSLALHKHLALWIFLIPSQEPLALVGQDV